jgi:uncharacterized RDD family membrane protein YckC
MTLKNDVSHEESIFPEAEIVYSRFWDRLGAFLLDGCIVVALTLPISYFNITTWKIPSLYVLIGLISILYKPFMEIRFGATLGKMIVGLEVVGSDFERVTIVEEVKRLSFYLFPAILQHIITLPVYFSSAFDSIYNYREFNRHVSATNPSLLWISGIVFVLLFADTVTFFINQPNRALHDVYAGTNVIEKRR